MEPEKTLVLIKPDGVQRSLVGKVITRFEDAGLKITAMKMIWTDEETAKNHYYLDEEWAKSAFEKTRKSCEEEGKEVKYKDHMELGQTLQKWSMNFLTEGPIIAMVLEGPHAIELVRKMIGSTEPRKAAPGTIRGDMASVESYAVGDKMQRVLRNIVHASDSTETAKREIGIWFSIDEIHTYKKELDKHFTKP